MTNKTRSLSCAVLDGSEESERILIHDTVKCNGRPLLKYGLHQLIKRLDAVHLVLSDIDAEHWVKGLPTDITTRLSIHCYTCGLHDTSVHVFLSQLTTAVNASHTRTALVIDSLSSLLLYLQVAVPNSPPVPTLCRWLHSMQPHVVLALVHSDLHEQTVLMQLDSIATSNMQVRPTAQPCPSRDYSGVVYTAHRRLSGKILKQTETYSIIPTCVAMDTTNLLTPPQSSSTSKAVDPAANLTFDLHLSSQEKMDRAQVVLPYTSAQQGAGLVGVSSQTPSGQIFYQPDELDDFDDSDPDDDLEF